MSDKRMPRPIFRPVSAPRGIDSLKFELEAHDPQRAALEYPWADRFVMGMPLAPWQREFKWTPKQCQDFIDSAWKGVYLGSYLVTEMKLENDTARVQHEFMSGMVLDGQQRLTALELYFKGDFPTPDAQGDLVYWQDLGVVDQRFFERIIFTRSEVPLGSELDMRQLYDTLNFGGVAHLESERAVKPASMRPV